MGNYKKIISQDFAPSPEIARSVNKFCYSLSKKHVHNHFESILHAQHVTHTHICKKDYTTKNTEWLLLGGECFFSFFLFLIDFLKLSTKKQVPILQ